MFDMSSAPSDGGGETVTRSGGGTTELSKPGLVRDRVSEAERKVAVLRNERRVLERARAEIGKHDRWILREVGGRVFRRPVSRGCASRIPELCES